MYPCLLLKVLAKYYLQLCACSEKRLLCCLCSCTPSEEIPAQVTSQGGGGGREAAYRRIMAGNEGICVLACCGGEGRAIGVTAYRRMSGFATLSMHADRQV